MLPALFASQSVGSTFKGVALGSTLTLALLFPSLLSAQVAPPPPISVPTGKPAAVVTYHNDNRRTGVNSSETAFITGTAGNISSATFGKIWTRIIDGSAYAQPLFVPSVSYPNGRDFQNQLGAVYNTIFVCTTHNTIYAFDAGGSVQIKNPTSKSKAIQTNPLWQINFNNYTSGITPVSTGDVGSNELTPEVGIIGTPVIDCRTDPKTGYKTGTMYVVAKTRESGGIYVQRLHAIDITSGKERVELGSPLVISGYVDGTGDGSLIDPINDTSYIPFNPLTSNQQAALTLTNPGTANATLYIAWGSHGDVTPYHGWVMSYDANTLTPNGIFNSSPNQPVNNTFDGAGIYGSGAGPAVDDQGNVFVSTGAGDFNADPVVFTGGTEYANSVLKLQFLAPIKLPGKIGGAKTLKATGGGKRRHAASSNQAVVTDYFTPFNWSDLSDTQADLGAGGIIVLPDVGNTTYPNLLVTAGKEGKLYLINRDAMGGFTFGSDAVVQSLDNAVGSVYGSPAFWNNTVYYQGAGFPLSAFKFTGGLLNPVPDSVGAKKSEYPGASPVVSTAPDGSNAIVWTVESATYAPYSFFAPTEAPVSVLHAYDANDLTKQLFGGWDAGTRDVSGPSVQFTPPLVANGRVYVVSDRSISAFGDFAANGVTPKPVEAHHFVVQGPTNVVSNVPEWYSVTAVGPDGNAIKLNADLHLAYRDEFTGDGFTVIKTLAFRNETHAVFSYAFSVRPGQGLFPFKSFYVGDDDGHSNFVEGYENLGIFPSVIVNSQSIAKGDHLNVTAPATAKSGSKVTLKIVLVSAKETPVLVSGTANIDETLPDTHTYRGQTPVRFVATSTVFAPVTVDGIGNHVYIVTLGNFTGTVVVKGTK